MNRRRLLTITSAIVLTLVGMWIIVVYVNNAEERAVGNEELTNVLVPVEEIPAGTSIEEMQNLVTVQSVPADLRPDDAVTDLAEVGNLVTDVDLLPGEPIRSGRFTEPGQGGRSGGAVVDEGDQIVSITLESQRALGGRIRAGQRVGILISIDQAEIPDDQNAGQTTVVDTTTGFVLNDIPVVAVDGGGEGGGVMVSLSVDQSEAGRVVFGAEHGRIWLTEQNEQTVTAGGRIRTPETIYQGTPTEDS